MADVVRNIRIRATTEGVDEATRSLNALTSAEGNVAAGSQDANRATELQQRTFEQLLATLNRVEQTLRLMHQAQLAVFSTQSRFVRQQVEASQQISAANDNMVRGMGGYTQAAQQSQDATRDLAMTMTNEGVRAAGGMTASFSGLSTTLLRLFGVGGVVVTAVAASMALFNQMSADLVEIDKAALRAGMSLRDFQLARGAGQLVGVDPAAFAKGAEGLAKALNDARTEETALSKLLDANNIKYKDGTKLRIDQNQALKIAADLIRGAGDDINKAKVADAFGVKELLPLLRGGSGELERLTREAENAGAALDDEIIQKAAAFDREWTRMTASLSIQTRSLFGDLLGLVQDLADKLPKPTAASEERFQETQTKFDGWANFISKKWNELVKDLTRDEPLFNVVVSDAERLGEAFDYVARSAKRAKESMDALKSSSGGGADESGLISGLGGMGVPLPRSRPATTISPTEDTEAEKFLRRSAEQRASRLRMAELELELLGKTEQQAISARLEQEQLNRAKERDITLTQTQKDEIKKWADQMSEVEVQLRRTREALRTIEQLGSSFLTSFFQSLSRGESLVSSFRGAVGGLASSLISLGSRQVMGGLTTAFSAFGEGGLSGAASAFGSSPSGPLGLALMAIGSAVNGIVTLQNQREQRQEQLRQQTQEGQRRLEDRLDSLRERAFMSRLDTQTIEGALAEFDFRAARERLGPAALGGKGGPGGEELALLEESIANERLAIIKRFTDEAIAEEKRRAEEVARVRQDLEDRLFATTVDTSTLQGALLEFDRRAARERAEIARDMAELLPDLERALAAERLQIVEDFNERAAEEQRRAAEEFAQFVSQVRRNIQQFIDNLTSGPQSILSPSARLTAAQTAFATQFATASTPGPEQQAALSTITQSAQNVIDAARAMFGTTTAFQTIQSSIISQLQSLPDLVDPVQQLNETMVQVRDNTGDTVTETGATASNTQTANTNLVVVIARLDSTILRLIDVLAAIGPTDTQGLHATMNGIENLSVLIRLNSRTIAEQSGFLEAIAFNTRFAYTHTAILQGSPAGFFNEPAGASPGAKAPGFATGGTLAPGQTGIMSEHSSVGPIMIRAGRRPVPISPIHLPVVAGGELVEQVAALRAEVAALRAQLVAATTAGAEHVREGIDHVVAGQAEARREVTFRKVS